MTAPFQQKRTCLLLIISQRPEPICSSQNPKLLSTIGSIEQSFQRLFLGSRFYHIGISLFKILNFFLKCLPKFRDRNNFSKSVDDRLSKWLEVFLHIFEIYFFKAIILLLSNFLLLSKFLTFSLCTSILYVIQKRAKMLRVDLSLQKWFFLLLSLLLENIFHCSIKSSKA